jgi:hypothetical protein
MGVGLTPEMEMRNEMFSILLWANSSKHVADSTSLDSNL